MGTKCQVTLNPSKSVESIGAFQSTFESYLGYFITAKNYGVRSILSQSIKPFVRILCSNNDRIYHLILFG